MRMIAWIASKAPQPDVGRRGGNQTAKGHLMCFRPPSFDEMMKTCPNCGGFNPPEAVKCKKCGTDLGSAASGSGPAPAPGAPKAPGAPAAPGAPKPPAAK